MTSTIEVELAPCPFCGWTDMDNGGLCHPLYSDDNPSEVIGPSGVCCPHCGAYALGGMDDDEAIAAWNRRSPAVVTGEARVEELDRGEAAEIMTPLVWVWEKTHKPEFALVAATVKHAPGLIRAVEDAVLECARRPADLRGPWIMDEAELQAQAATIRKRRALLQSAEEPKR